MYQWSETKSSYLHLSLDTFFPLYLAAEGKTQFQKKKKKAKNPPPYSEIFIWVKFLHRSPTLVVLHEVVKAWKVLVLVLDTHSTSIPSLVLKT